MKAPLHQIQGEDTCMSTSLAMALGIDQSIVIARAHEAFMASGMDMDTYIHRFHPEWNCQPLLSSHSSFRYDRWYLLCVPSLNVVAGMHTILAWFEEDVNDGHFCIDDPNRGKPGRRYYIRKGQEPANELEIPLGGWMPDYELWRSDSHE